jgi:nitrite reductase/ring-hydroxylating ferredoxin subunit
MGDRRDLAPGADAAVAIGLAGAVGAAVTGVTDWSATDGEARRLGMAHGLMNVGVAALYGASLLCRQRGDRSTGRQLAALGYAVGMVSAYLGGHLVFAKRIGVDHADVEGAPDQFTRVLRADELAENQPRRVEVDGVPVLLVRQGERIFALAETCSHLGGPLSEGEIEGCSVRCPWHGSRFALDDGRVLDGPATNPQPRFDARVRDGHIEIRLAGADTTDAAPTDGATEHLAQPTAAQPTPTTVNGETQGSTAAQDASI